MLSNRQQVARLRRLAIRALGEYPLVAPELRFVAHGENTTFRVDAMTVDGRDRFLLRVHRPARHGQRLDSAAAVGSELDWLTALRADTALSVPGPFRTTDGRLTTTAAFKDVPEPRVCSMLRWMDGRVHAAVPRPVHLRRLGSVMARLHNHAAQWRLPPGFARMRWDWETFFGDTMVYGGINAADVWDLIPGDLRRRFDQVASRMQRVMTQLGDGGDQVGLIHADLHLKTRCSGAMTSGSSISTTADSATGSTTSPSRYGNCDSETTTSSSVRRSSTAISSIGHCHPEALLISMTSSLPARSHLDCGLPAPRRSTPPSVPTFPRCWRTSATRWTPFSQARRQARVVETGS